MAYTTINKSSLHMNTKLYTGTGSSNALTGINFQPDLTWIKKRDGTNYHVLTDAVRGATKQIYSNDTGAEQAVAEGLKSFDSDGFTLGTNGDTNGNGGSYVGWNWKANGAGVANTDGTISSTVSANTTSEFSIVKYTGNSTSGATIGHGLSSAPSMIIIKRLTNINSWITYHSSLGATKMIFLDQTSASTTSAAPFNNTSPTNSVFTVDGNGGYAPVNLSGEDYIAYCFAEKTGYSKISSYVGNGSTDGTFIYTGFKPALIIMKRSDAAGNNWRIFDNKRSTSGFNVIDKTLRPNVTTIEGSSNIDFLSNGVKIRNTDAEDNTSGGTYIYMAFGQSLVGSNNVPCTAR